VLGEVGEDLPQVGHQRQVVGTDELRSLRASALVRHTTGAVQVRDNGAVPRAVVEVVDGDVAIATVAITGVVPELFVVDVAARLQLAAGRLGWTVRLCAPSPRVATAVELAGLGDQLGRQAERREDADVEEMVQRDQPTA
jgi:hypothetical protein